MATKVWDSSDGDWSAAGSWSPSGVPVSNDSVVFPSSSSQAVTSGLDQSAVDLDDLIIEEGFLPDIGASGSQLQIGADYVVHRGSGSLFISSKDSPLIDKLVIDSPNWDNACTVGKVSGTGQHFTTISVRRGKLIGLSGASTPRVDNLFIYYRTHENDAVVDLSNDCNVYSIFMRAGKLTVKDPLNLIITGGQVEIVEATTSTINQIWQSDGFVDVHGLPSSGDHVTNLYVLGGEQTWLNDQRPKSINKLLVFPGARLDLPETITVTSGGNFITPVTIGG